MGRFDKVSAATDKPLVLYNSPRRMGFSLTVDQTERLLDNHNVIGDQGKPARFLLPYPFAGTPGQAHVGDDRPMSPYHARLRAGGQRLHRHRPRVYRSHTVRHGAVGASAPDETYRKAHYQLTVLYELLMGTATWPASFKAALNLIGLPAGIPRDPVLPATDADIDKIKRTFDQLGITYQT